MGKVKIGINGFGRIGRLVLRAVCDKEGVEVVGINDPFIDPNYAAYMIKYDSVHGTFNADVKVEGDYLVVNGNKIKFFAQMNPEDVDWAGVKADYVAEATGKFTKAEDAAEVVRNAANTDINTIFGAVINENLNDEIIVTVIATGFDDVVPEEQPTYIKEREIPENTVLSHDLLEGSFMRTGLASDVV